ncbi:MAG: hypothetical protein IPL46_35780 [Saprospiraceae bacterium]|nr:hypothetical protein [Saprospiraceae bacterium]
MIQKVSQLEQSAADALGPYIVSAATGIPPQFMSSQNAKNAISDMASAAIGVQNEILGLIGAVSGDGKGHIGPRYLYIPTKQVTGELIATERTFIITPSSYNKVTVTIKKRDGKAGAGVAVCAKWADGREYNTKDQKYFADGEQSIGTTQSWVFANMKDKFLTIHLVHTGGVLNYFDYELSIEGEWDAADLYAISSTKPSSGNKGFVKGQAGGVTDNTTSGSVPDKSAATKTTPSEMADQLKNATEKASDALSNESAGGTTPAGQTPAETKPAKPQPKIIPSKLNAVKNRNESAPATPSAPVAEPDPLVKSPTLSIPAGDRQPVVNPEKPVAEPLPANDQSKRENKQQKNKNENRPDKDDAKDRMKEKKAENKEEAEKEKRKDKIREKTEDKKDKKNEEEAANEKKGNAKEKNKQKRNGQP